MVLSRISKAWNVYKRGTRHASVGGIVHRDGKRYRVLGTLGGDTEGVPYLRLEPLDGENRKELVCLLTELEVESTSR